MIRFIDAHQSDPFFLFVSYLEPHHHHAEVQRSGQRQVTKEEAIA